LPVDPCDWSWRNAKKFNKVDNDRRCIMDSKQYNFMGKDKQKRVRAEVLSKHLGRWSFKG